jgi:Flp pilus assembly protein TadG
MSIPVETVSRQAPRRRLLRDASGAAAVEFAMVAFPFIAITVAVLELAVDYLYFSQLDYAAHKASEQIRSGVVIADKISAADFRSKFLCPQLTLFDCNKLLVNAVTVANESNWSGGGGVWAPTTINPSAARWCPGGSAQITVLQVAYPVPLASFVWAGQLSNANGVRYYMAASAFRNDAFSLAAPATAGC